MLNQKYDIKDVYSIVSPMLESEEYDVTVEVSGTPMYSQTYHIKSLVDGVEPIQISRSERTWWTNGVKHRAITAAVRAFGHTIYSETVSWCASEYTVKTEPNANMLFRRLEASAAARIKNRPSPTEMEQIKGMVKLRKYLARGNTIK